MDSRQYISGRHLNLFLEICTHLACTYTMPVHFYENDVRSGLKDKRKLAAFMKSLTATYRPEVKKISLDYIFCDDAYLIEINRQFLQHDTYTDIITFDLSDQAGHLNGEIYISVERVKENAQRFEHTYIRELHRVIFHGVLHLCGFKDKTKEQKAIMRAREDDCIHAYLG